MQSIVYARNVQWVVVVPIGMQWAFMKEFGEAFRLNDPMEGTNFIRPVDGYHEHPNGWHIQVTVHESQESQLNQFCKQFCASRQVEFRDPDIERAQQPMDAATILDIVRRNPVGKNVAVETHDGTTKEGRLDIADEQRLFLTVKDNRQCINIPMRKVKAVAIQQAISA